VTEHRSPTASTTAAPAAWRSVPWSTAAQATLHCLTGCASGEVAGMGIGTAAELPNAATVALSLALAFVFGYVIWSCRGGVLHVEDGGVRVRGLRGGRGYLPPSIRWIFWRKRACAAGGDACLVG